MLSSHYDNYSLLTCHYSSMQVYTELKALPGLRKAATATSRSAPPPIGEEGGPPPPSVAIPPPQQTGVNTTSTPPPVMAGAPEQHQRVVGEPNTTKPQQFTIGNGTCKHGRQRSKYGPPHVLVASMRGSCISAPHMVRHSCFTIGAKTVVAAASVCTAVRRTSVRNAEATHHSRTIRRSLLAAEAMYFVNTGPGAIPASNAKGPPYVSTVGGATGST